MSFDIFKEETTWPTLSEMFDIDPGWVWVMVLAPLAAIVVAVLLDQRSQHGGAGPTLAQSVVRNTGVVVVMLALAFAAVWGLSFETRLANTAEVKEMIQQEYGIELTDESLEFLSESPGHLNKEQLHVVDVHGQLHPYVVIGDEFHFVDSNGESQ